MRTNSRSHRRSNGGLDSRRFRQWAQERDDLPIAPTLFDTIVDNRSREMKQITIDKSYLNGPGVSSTTGAAGSTPTYTKPDRSTR